MEREAELDRERRVGRRLRWLSAVLALVGVVAVVLAMVSWHLMDKAATAQRAAIDSSHTALAEELSSRAQVMLLTDYSGSEFEAITDLLAAHHISPDSNIGGQLTALVVTRPLSYVIDAKSRLTGDGQRAVTTTPSGIQMLDTETGEAVGAPFAGHDSPAAISYDGRYIAVVDIDNTTQVWDSHSGRPIGQPMHDAEGLYVRQAAVTEDGHRAATVNKGAVLLWDVDSGTSEKLRSPRPDEQVTAVAFSRDGLQLATGADDGTVTLWDSTNGEVVREMSSVDRPRAVGGQRTVDTSSVSFSPDGSAIAAGADVSPGGTQLRIWNTSNGETVAAQGINENAAIAVAFSPDGSRIVTGVDTTEQQWDARGHRIGEPLKFRTPVSQVAFDARGDRVVTASTQTLQVVDSNRQNGLAAEVGGSRAAHLGDGQTPFAVYVLDEGLRIATVRDSALRWLNIDTGDQIGPTVVSDALRGIAQFDISPDRKWLAVAGTDNDVRVIDALTGRLHGAPMKGHKGTVTQVGFSPDGNSLVSGSEDTTVRVWDWRTGRQVGDPMTGHDRGLKTVSFGKDGRRLYSMSSDSIRVWDTTTHQEVGKPIRGSYFTTSAVSPDGRRIATVESDATIQQWDAESGQPVGPQVPGHLRSTTDIEYNSDGRYLVSVGMDATLRFWDARTGDPTGTPVRATTTRDIQDVALSKDDRRVFVSAWRSDDTGGGGIWEVPGPAAWPEMLCAKLASNPTEAEWKQWVSSDPDLDYVKLCPDKPDRP
jgi:WD40 repeat protein